jgi:hypothetical protein
MSKLDTETIDMLRTSLRPLLLEPSGAPFADRLDELGWADVVAQDASTALRTLFEMKGETLSNADALGPALATALATELGEPDLATATVALPSPVGPTTADGDHLSIDVMVLSNASVRVVAQIDDGRVAVFSANDLSTAQLGGTDDELGLLRITGTTTAQRWLDAAAWNRVVATGRWLLSCELVGIARHVLDAAVDYTKERVQYGQPIGAFQALQHRIAAAHVSVAGAGHLALEAGDAGDEWSAMVAKCMAGQAAETACTQAQQAYGAIGFTWEHEFHRYLRRTYMLDRLFGDWRSLEHEIGTRLQATGVVPRIGSL